MESSNNNTFKPGKSVRFFQENHTENKCEKPILNTFCGQLNTGDQIPIIGLGTWSSKGDELYEAIRVAVEAGYRHFDTAFAYQNETDIGRAIKDLISEGKITRREIFITTKLWNTCHRRDLVREALFNSLRRLQMNYIDLYLIHTPCAFAETNDHVVFPRDESKNIIYADVDYIDAWNEMVKLSNEGLVKNIGVSNFNVEQLNRIIRTGFLPAVLQIECHPFLTQTDLLHFCRRRGIHVTSHCPLGSPNRVIGFNGLPKLLDNKTIYEIAKLYGKTPAQILIRYQIEKGNSVIPKSVREDRIQLNIMVFDFCIKPDDMDMLDALNCDLRYCALLE